MSTTNLHQRLQGLLTSIQQGKIMEAMNEYYDADTVMQDNANQQKGWRPTSSARSSF